MPSLRPVRDISHFMRSTSTRTPRAPNKSTSRPARSRTGAWMASPRTTPPLTPLRRRSTRSMAPAPASTARAAATTITRSRAPSRPTAFLARAMGAPTSPGTCTCRPRSRRPWTSAAWSRGTRAAPSSLTTPRASCCCRTAARVTLSTSRRAELVRQTGFARVARTGV